MRIAIVEDEAIIARRLERMVRDIVGPSESIEVAPTFHAALDMIRRPLDLLFLDLNLSGRDGFALLEEAAASAFQTVVVSAHHDQALRAFDYGVTDFVAKPWSEARLRAAIERVGDRQSCLSGQAGLPVPHKARKLVIRKGRELRTIDPSQIVFVRGADDYSELHLGDGSVHLHEKSLTALEAILPSGFARVHRSYIANLAGVRGIRGAALVFESGAMVPIGRTYRDNVRQRLLLE